MSVLYTWFGGGLDEDWVDRANGFWSVLVITLCSLGSFFIRYITNPISCSTPPQFTQAINQHALDTCFMKDTHYLPLLDFIPTGPPGPRVSVFKFYHLWVPFILFVQALCFKIPNILWTSGKRSMLINIDETIESLAQAQTQGEEIRRSAFNDAARVLESLLKRNSFWLGVLYLVVKLLFLLNLAGQFIFVTIFFRQELLAHVGNSSSIPTVNPIFPKVVLCDFDIRQVSNVHRYTVQCIFSITDIYEKMYVFLWYWIFFLAVATFFNLLLWGGCLFIPFLRDSKISAYIKAAPGPAKDSSSITRFISSCLGLDGALLMSMISQNSSEMVAANLCQEMYQVFLERDRPMPYTQPVVSTSGSAGYNPTSGAVGVDPGTESVPMTNMEATTGTEEKPPIV